MYCLEYLLAVNHYQNHLRYFQSVIVVECNLLEGRSVMRQYLNLHDVVNSCDDHQRSLDNHPRWLKEKRRSMEWSMPSVYRIASVQPINDDDDVIGVIA